MSTEEYKVFTSSQLDEESNFKLNPFFSKQVRHAFIRKVYSLLTLQLMVTTGICALFMFNDKVNSFASSEGGQALFWISIVATFAILITLCCSQNLARRHPHNYILLGLFTLAQSYILGIVTSSYNTSVVLMAFGTTIAITLTLTLFAWQTKYDFTTMRGGLLAALVGIIVLNVINIFLKNNILSIVISCFGVVIFSGYIVYDTQLIVGGNHKYSYGIDDYVFATISLYLDIINLFLYLLQLFGRRD